MTIEELEALMIADGPVAAYAELTNNQWADKLERMIPDHMREGVVRWVAYGRKSNPGSFLTAVLRNDLAGAASRADIWNATRLAQYPLFFIGYTPVGARHYDTWQGIIKEEDT